MPRSLNDFVDLVIPELQRRGMFRKEYQGKTLRERMGLPMPANPMGRQARRWRQSDALHRTSRGAGRPRASRRSPRRIVRAAEPAG